MLEARWEYADTVQPERERDFTSLWYNELYLILGLWLFSIVYTMAHTGGQAQQKGQCLYPNNLPPKGNMPKVEEKNQLSLGMYKAERDYI